MQQHENGQQTKALTTTSNGGASMAGLGEMRVQDIIDRKRKLVEVMEAVMIDGVHYGKIPGCGDKPTLLKAGAEILATVFGLAPIFKITQIDLANGHREYQIVCTLIHIGTGKALGEGVGSCSTMESKYRWRAGQRLCPECGKATIIKGKAEYGGGWLCFAKKGGCNAKWKDGDQVIEGQSADRSENPDIADQHNTVLKMAKKRAQIDCTLTAVGASDILTQDLEDLPAGSVVAPSPRGDAEDADFVDRPAQQRSVKVSDSVAQYDAPEKIDFTALAARAGTIEDLERIAAPWRNYLKGTRERREAYEAYTVRAAEINQGAQRAAS